MTSLTGPIAMTIGDPAGIGPELSLRIASEDGLVPDAPLLLVGSADLLERVSREANLDVVVRKVTDPREFANETGVAHVLDVPLDAMQVAPGRVDPLCGRATVQGIEIATELALEGVIEAVVSAPANKEAFNAAGYHYEGQTEIFADLTKTVDFHTLLVGGPFRVSLVSAHCSMLEAVARVTQPRIERILGELHSAMQLHFGLENPRIGIAGLNPHAGENGVFGTEEIEHVRPALENCRARGMDLSDPLASDSLFAAAEAGRYDAVLAMYHDQGTIPLKRYGYVTYAAGLPIVRTTAGHGTAFDIAWKGIADPALLARAAALAASLASTSRVTGQ